MAFWITKTLHARATGRQEDLSDAGDLVPSLVGLVELDSSANSSWRDANIGHAYSDIAWSDPSLLRHAASYYFASLASSSDYGVNEGVIIWSILASTLVRISEMTGQMFEADELFGALETLQQKGLDNVGERELAEGLASLCRAYMHIFERTRLKAALDSAIDTAQEARNLTPEGDSTLVWRVLDLAGALCERYRWLGALVDLDYAIELTTWASSGGSDHEKASSYSALSFALLYRYLRTGSQEDLTNSISSAENAIQLALSTNSDDYSSAAPVLAAALFERFRFRGSVSDSDRAVELTEKALDLMRGHSDGSATLQSNLTEMLLDRIVETGSMEDLTKALSYAESALAATSDGDLNYYERLQNYALVTQAVYRYLGPLECLNEGTEMSKSALLCLSEETPVFLGQMMHQFAILMCERFDRSRYLDDINEAVDTMERTIRIAVDTQRSLADYLQTLSDAQRKRYKVQKDPADLENALKNSDEALKLNPRKWVATDFYCLRGLVLLTKYETSNSPNDLDEAVGDLRKAVELAELHRGKPVHAWPYHNLSVALRLQFDETGSLDKLNESIRCAAKACLALPDPHINVPLFAYHFGRPLYLRFQISASIEDLRVAVTMARIAVEKTPTDHPNHFEYSDFLRTLMEAISNVDDWVDPDESNDAEGGRRPDLTYSNKRLKYG